MSDGVTTWASELDAMTAAPNHHELLLENDRVRVLDSLVRPGESTPVHTHEWAGVLYVIGSSDFVRRDERGVVLMDSRESGKRPTEGEAFWTSPLPPHSVTNVGDRDLHIISVEIKI